MIDPARDRLDRPEGFALSVEDAGGDVRVIVRGEIDVATSDELRVGLVNLFDEGASHVVLDLSRLEFIDSTGLGALIRVLKHYRSNGGELKLQYPTPPVAKVLEITGLDQLFDIVPADDAEGAEAAPA